MKSNRQRPAFTLVELLVVISIIMVLISLSFAAVMKTINVRQRNDTQASLNSLYAALMSHWKAVIDDARQETSMYGVGTPAYQMANGDINRARVIWIKARLKQQFPMSYAEANTGMGALMPPPPIGPPLPVGFPPSAIGAEPSYVRILKIGTLNAASNPATEPAACLLMALTARDRRGVNVSQAFLGSLQKRDSDGDGIPEISDVWNNPILFVRWPIPQDYALMGSIPTPYVTNFELMNGWNQNWNQTNRAWSQNPSNGQATETFHDPQDPVGTLQATNWAGKGSFSGSLHSVTAPPYPSVPGNLTQGLYLVPALVSAGPDRIFGLRMTQGEFPGSNWGPLVSTTDFGLNPAKLDSTGAPAYQDNIYSDPSKTNQ